MVVGGGGAFHKTTGSAVMRARHRNNVTLQAEALLGTVPFEMGVRLSEIPLPTRICLPALQGRPWITELCLPRSPDPQLCLFPTTPDVLIPSRSVTTSFSLFLSFLQRIQFLYPASLRELLRLLASLHETWPGGSPSLILLDSLEEYLASCPGPHAAAQLVALLLDTANHFGRKCGGAEPAGCHLMVSVRLPGDGGEGAEQLSVVQRYFVAQCCLHPEALESGSSGGRGGAKLVRARLSQPGAEDQEWLLRFEPQEEMKISPLPCPRDGGVASGSQRPPATGTDRILGLWWPRA
ncbi:PREDICTED: ATPase SWSAP1 [Gekko japonicus]|uniref:ATPase SWSAP1 n=1 Tax=Gekko japonicus TaxID=146911 RepID=A0ABM1KFI2_GEKJA|nr:PREDICTED: ATPase SWSAP1 [Gekko japonicus]